MKKKIFILSFLLLLPFSLVAYDDYDMDGVENSKDECPNSLITDLVDIKGCVVEALVSPHHYDIVVGLSFSQVNYTTTEETNTVSESIQFDYFYKDFSVQLSTSYFNTSSDSFSSSGLNDTFLAAYYAYKPWHNLSVRVGAGFILPTYDSDLDNNNLDYIANLSLSYSVDSMNIFGGYGLTLVNDDDIVDVAYYQNTSSFYAGIGYYPTSKLYLSASYNSTDSVYDGGEVIESASIYSYYSIDENWFTTFNYGYGLSDSASDHSASLRLGYYF